MIKEFHVWTDGAHHIHTTKIGGWGYVIIDPHTDKILYEDCGCEQDTTSMEMEIKAAIYAISYIIGNFPGGNYVIHSDSQVLVKAVNDWIPSWKKNKWRRSGNKEIINEQLWKDLDEALEMLNAQFKWVKGHDGTKYNEQAHKLAEKGISKCKNQT